MITVIGLGFVGLTTALGFSDKGFNVLGVDTDKNKVASINNGILPFYEKGLDVALNNNINKNFKIASSIKDAANSKIFFICVGTPSDENGKADLKYIKSAINSILQNIKKEDKKIIIIKSTIPPSTTVKELYPFVEEQGFKIDEDVYLLNNPEFLREGCAWQDFTEPDRIVIGLENEYPKTYLDKIYEPFNAPIHYVSLNTGEFIKYLSNSFLATLISYSNEMSMIADNIGDIDVKSAFKIFHEDKRWFGTPANMQSYAYPGCGFGGYCLPKDTLALYNKAKENNYNAKIIGDVLKVNSEIKPHWIDKIRKNVKKEDRITILGLAFKPNSDDIRQTPALEIIKLLLKDGFTNIVAYDPVSNELFKKTYNLPIEYSTNINDALNDSSNVLILTAWDEFKENKNLLIDKNVYDLRYIM